MTVSPQASSTTVIGGIMRDFVRHLTHTFGQGIKYVGTTTKMVAPLSQIRDLDILLLFTEVNETHVSYVWRIINRLRAKYKLLLDTRIHAAGQLEKIPVLNRYLLKLFLDDHLGENPFKDFHVPSDTLHREALRRLRAQQDAIVAKMPRVADDPAQLREVAQSVYDAIRAYLVLVDQPVAGKDDACTHMVKHCPDFSEAQAIYEGYLAPDTVIDVGAFILDSLALVKHLLYRAEQRHLVDEVLLINTPSSLIPHPRNDYLSYDHNMPLGLVCLASYLKRDGYAVRILDAYAENLGALSTVDRIFAGEPLPRIVGFNTSSPNIHIVHRMARYLKRICSDLTLVCGGPHASLATKHTLETGHVDYAVAGEGELPFAKLVKRILVDKQKADGIPGVYCLVAGRVVGTPSEEFLDLSGIPAPDFDLLPIDRYFAVRKRVYIHTSRGCAFNCIYCSVPRCWGRKVREIPSDLLVSQIREIVARYHPEELQVVDDNFSHKRGRLVRRFCEGLCAAGVKIRWKCQVRADQLDAATIELMRDAGCFEIDLGVETGNDEMQKYIRKNLDLEKTLDVASAISDDGILVKAFMMLGFPGESDEQIQDTVNYTIKLKERGVSDVAFFPVMPFPGTEISELVDKVVFQGAIMDDVDTYERSFAAHRLRKYSARPEISLNPRFTPEELRLLVKFAYQRFSLQSPVKDFRQEFLEFVKTEEDYAYGL